MDKYNELVELALICAGNAHAVDTDEAARTLWRMAEEYRAKAAELGGAPDIGPPPLRIRGR